MSTAEGDFDPAVACATNAIINAVDAVCVHYQGERSSSGNHYEAINLLARVADLDASLRGALQRHLEAVLEPRHLAQYEGRLMNRAEAEQAVRHMERALRAVDPIAQANGWET